MKTNEIYGYITNKIIDHLEGHKGTWKKPWISFAQDNDLARNPSTQKYYRGINQFLLSISLAFGDNDYSKNQWMTFNQIKGMKGQVTKGQKATPIIFYKMSYKDKEGAFMSAERAENLNAKQSNEEGITSIPVIKLYHVFNVAQTQGLDESFYKVDPLEPLNEFTKNERAEDLIIHTGANIEVTQSNQAYYDPLKDKIRLPLREQFRGQAEPFYATALHELGHWTGAPHRLNRVMDGSFGDKEYAKEELIAELCSSFCCAALGFTSHISQNAAYIDGWLKMLKQDNRAIVSAASKAQKAADYILQDTHLLL